MLQTVTSYDLDGLAATRVRVQVDILSGQPGFALVGLPKSAGRECRESLLRTHWPGRSLAMRLPAIRRSKCSTGNTSISRRTSFS